VSNPIVTEDRKRLAELLDVVTEGMRRAKTLGYDPNVKTTADAVETLNELLASGELRIIDANTKELLSGVIEYCRDSREYEDAKEQYAEGSDVSDHILAWGDKAYGWLNGVETRPLEEVLESEDVDA